MITLIYSIYNDTHYNPFATTEAFPFGNLNALLSHEVDKEQIDFKQIHLLSLLSPVLLFLLEMCCRLNSVKLTFPAFLYAGVGFTGLFWLP